MKKSISILLSLMIIIGLFSGMSFPVSATEDDNTALGAICGTTGDCTWMLDDNGTLTISGNGEMADYGIYSDSERAPWYSYRTSIKTLVLNSGVTSIGMGAFYSCTSLTNFSIPDSVIIIGDYAFRHCTKLTSVSIPDSVKKIGKYVLFNCEKLTYVTIGNSVISIGEDSFGYCKNLKTVNISDSVTNIGSYAFYMCSALKDVNYNGSKKQWDKISIGDGNSSLISANIHYAIESVKHTINSADDNTRYFYFNEDEEIEDLVFSKASTEYNPRLAHFLACMARSAYSSELVCENYRELGFEPNHILLGEHYDTSDKIAGYNIGKRLLENGKVLVLITIRGSSGFFTDPEWTQTDFNTELRKSDLSYSVGIHTGFEESEKVLYESLKDFLGGSIQKQNTTYVITGHSLGGAVGNLLAMRLYNEGVSNQDVYDYNFACPLVGAGSEDASVWNDNGVHNNIITVNNWFDLVPSKPTLGDYSSKQVMDYSYNGWRNFKRFGATYWFDNGFMNYFDAHNMCAYIDYLAKLNDKSHFRDEEYVIDIVSVHCPVDVVVYDKKGNPIAGTMNNIPNYYNYEAGEKAVIFVNGDKKQFYILNNEPFEVYLTGTDEGKMDYGFFTVNSTREETLSDKWFKSVQLTEGKEMTSVVTDYLDTSDTQLFFVDNDKNIEQEILGDGTEVNPIFVSESKVELLFGSKVTLTVESADDYRWYSTNESVATVQNGVVTACGNGEANIVAETVNGARAICKIQVNDIGVISGTTGDCTWTLDDIGTLTISGNGAMDNYSSAYNNQAPWGTEIKKAVIEYGVTSIGGDVFNGCSNLASITIPSSVKSIGYDAFSGCTGLTSITIPDSVTSIGFSAFDNTAFYNDENNWENDVLYLNHILLKSRYQLSGSYQVKEGTTVIADGAFMGSYLEHITLPDSVITIGDSAFSFCLYGLSVNMPNSVTKIGACAFERTPLKSIVIPDSIKTIESGTFADSYITNLYIPRSVKTIKNAFFAAEWAQYTQELIKNVYYSGSKSEWDNIDIYSSNSSLFLASIHYDISACSVSLNQDKYTFTGKEIRPEIVVKDGATNLINGTDYSITYPNAVDEGTYFVTITGKGDYFGSASISFSVGNQTETGDINGDNSIDVLDATLIQKYSVDKTTLTDEQKTIADVNNDGVVDILDATMIQKFAVEKITEFKKKA